MMSSSSLNAHCSRALSVTNSVDPIAQNFFIITITLAVIFVIDWQLALLSVSLLPLFIYPIRLVGRLR